MSDVAKRYARALFEVAEAHGHVDEIEDDLTSVVSVFEKEGYHSLFQNPRMKIEEKQALIDSFSTAVSAETTNLLKLLTDRSREKELEEIAREYVAIANEARNIADATVTTAVPLTDEEKQQLAKQFGEALNKTLRMNTQVDADVVGGVLLRIGNRVYDGSIAGKLSRFKQRLTQSQVR